ncbi:Transaldolase [bioreactor metagenome]|jgi:transaldolase|uniref:Transaldolase n=1 Tax=bioreactor metagenome TaxID=1076179 RepID=A0A644XS39_9ZZZZ|nr:transaldolase [Aminivibrio sp.]MDD3514209.1 transaldolase [Synergistaceae bacterium]MEA4951776.1 transaldolase [Aminivibrio sp.]
MTQDNTIYRALALGQSIWCDFLSRDLLRSGKLDKMIEDGVRGVTTNPSIFENAIGKTSDYDGDILSMVRQGKKREEIYTSLTVADVREAADRFFPIYSGSGGRDGFVSLEVSPLLAHDAEGTVSEAETLARLTGKKNVMIKIPATPEGMKAIRRCIALGINVNATLIFSGEQYRQVAEAFISGLEDRVSDGNPISGIASVASLFVSRVDTAVDKLLPSGNSGAALAGKIAVDNARAAYMDFESLFSSPRWTVLAEKGAQVQRPLWASTGTKNPDYSPTLYVDSLIGPHTVNTIPPATLEAFLAAGTVGMTVASDREGMKRRLDELEALGISLDEVTGKLLKEGLDAFEKAYILLLDGIEKKGQSLAG